MNKKNESIIRILGRKAGLSSRTLSKMLGIPISTVHRRVKRLEQDGIIVGYKALIDFEKTTWPIGALLLINLAEVISGTRHIPKKDVLNTLKHYHEIEEIIEVQAAYFDIVVKARFQSLKKLSAFIEELRHIEGIEETSSAIITDETVMPPPRFID
ncbi:Lrp/AsnC family transcriptional regulator [Candidatus Bathyarchaeota archaeon]|nr:Lrp/AsnC family transcriptional regulator [Candidatus Bathyarchaeota archaeon]MCK5625269.1 Lrp/AsnC family transcriptional regulator [Candidatus Bathyarchaeota archaeon]